MIIGILTKFFRESSWFRIIRTACLALFFNVAIIGHKLGHLNIFSEYVISELAMAVVSIAMIEWIDFTDEKAKETEKEENPPTQDDDEDKEEESQDKSLPRRRSQRKRKATVTFDDEQEEKDKIE